MGRYKIIVLMSSMLFVFSNSGMAQFSLGGGVSTFHGLNLPIHRIGFNMFGEFPRTPNNTFTLRAAYMFPKKYERTTEVSGKDGIVPSKVQAIETAKTTYFAIDGGTRYYFINDYDIGIAMYAGGYLKGILSSYSSKYRMPGSLKVDDYETNDYPPQPLTSLKPMYSILFSFGGGLGVKFQVPAMRGAITFDVGAEIVSRLMDPYAILGNDISPISFNMNLAYRFDWY
ncbi:MAG: hypothetical protein H3C31_06230 [Brumimicrobium sp.]|nr:hypothetical protein [Brumimicrobium sp.]MCO5268398.1 hypothetical protein [Brumimicrobium sp.]